VQIVLSLWHSGNFNATVGVRQRKVGSIHDDCRAHLWMNGAGILGSHGGAEGGKKRRRFHFHFTPTSSSWLNQVERFFALITDRMIRRGTFLCVGELERAIYQWLSDWNDEPQPFVWKATADVILDKVRRCREAIAKN